MLKLVAIGCLGCAAALAGVYVKMFIDQNQAAAQAVTTHNASLKQVKTEMTGVPVIREGRVAGYIVFQVSSTIDAAKLPTQEFDANPYLLDAAVRASLWGTKDDGAGFTSAFIDHLTEQLRREANMKLGAEAVIAVNIEAFNYVPKEDIRGKFVKTKTDHGQH